MKNRDRLNAMSDEELATFLCDVIEKIAANTPDKFVCDICPASELCRKGHNGILAWLNQNEKEA